MRVRSVVWGAVILMIGAVAPHRERKARSYDHVHFSVPDPKASQDWYMARLGGVVGESADRVTFGGMPYGGHPPLPVQMLWAKSAPGAQPVAGSAIESLGFSFADVEAKVRELRDAGVKIVSPVHDVPGLWKTATIEDPWGTQLELVQDSTLLGFHHVTLRDPDPDAAVRWYLKEFGGDRTILGGGLAAVKYGNMYVVVRRGDPVVPSPGYGINHIGFAAVSIDSTASRLKADGIKFTLEPRATLNQYGHRIAYVEGPSGVRIELVEHTKCMFTASAGETAAGGDR